jgi:ribonuclease-3
MKNILKIFETFEKKLNIKFKNKSLLVQAFVHRSFLNENPKFCMEHNERLEFLGDAVLELVITEFLYKNYKNPEGELTNWRASLVNAQMLSEVAKKLNFDDYLLLSKGEAKDKGKARQYILANTFESFLGALYLDQRYKPCQIFIHSFLIPELSRILKEGTWKDSKSLFQEIAQEKDKITPTYKVLKERGPDHTKHFTVGVFLKNEFVAEGEGFSKQEAEDNAAKKGLEAKGY